MKQTTEETMTNIKPSSNSRCLDSINSSKDLEEGNADDALCYNQELNDNQNHNNNNTSSPTKENLQCHTTSSKRPSPLRHRLQSSGISGYYDPMELPSPMSSINEDNNSNAGASDQRANHHHNRGISFVSSSGTTSDDNSTNVYHVGVFEPILPRSEEYDQDDDSLLYKNSLDDNDGDDDDDKYIDDCYNPSENDSLLFPVPTKSSENPLSITSDKQYTTSRESSNDTTAPINASFTQAQERRSRLSSEDIINAMAAAHAATNKSFPKFYDTDTDNGSIVFFSKSQTSSFLQNHMDTNKDNNTAIPSQNQSIANVNTITNNIPPCTPQRREISNHDTSTPHISNISNRNSTIANYQPSVLNSKDILPYHERRQGRMASGCSEDYNINDNDKDVITSTDFNSDKKLSTISSPFPTVPSLNTLEFNQYVNPESLLITEQNSQTKKTNEYGASLQNFDVIHQEKGFVTSDSNRSSPDYDTINYHQGMGQFHPPLHPTYPRKNATKKKNDYNKNAIVAPNKSLKNSSTTEYQNSNNHYQNNNKNNNNSKMKSQIAPIIHVRHESSGSVSSLGSLTGGASSITRSEGKALTDNLGNEINYFINNHDGGKLNHSISNNHYNSTTQHVQNREPPHGNYSNYHRVDSFGFLKKLRHSISNSSIGSGSGYNSLEDEKADFHDKNQAFLKKAEKEKAKLAKGLMREGSPVSNISLRSHRSRLPSIDNDNWEDERRNSSKDKRTSKNTKSNQFETSKKRNGDEHHHNIERKKSSSREDTYNMSNRKSSNHHEYGTQKNYGSLYHETHHRDDAHLRSTIRHSNSSNTRKQSNDSDSISQSSDNDSDVSSDFTSNQDSYNSKVSNLLQSGTDSDENVSFESESKENEHSRLLPPTGIRTYERDYKRRQRKKDIQPRSSNRSRNSKRDRDNPDEKFRQWEEKMKNSSRDHYHRKHNLYGYRGYHRSDSGSDSDGREFKRLVDYKAWQLLEKERETILAKWKAEFLEESKMLRAHEEYERWYNRFFRWIGSIFSTTTQKLDLFLSDTEAFISNLPLTIGAVALSIVTLGVVWFKFAEEMMDSCQPVHFHSSQCQFHEFPGCFYCDTNSRMYQAAYRFHESCSMVAGILAALFIAKVFIARRVVVDEMNSPTTSSPSGLFCMTIVCVFAGHGNIGKVMVSIGALCHFCLAAWFMYMTVTYSILPDPSWYPNTVGIGISAVKIWLYYPMIGHLLMATSLSLCLFFFPISLYRVLVNKKISAPVCWIQMSAPAVSLYALTIMAQPSFEEENPDITTFQRVHRMFYLPCMHGLFILAVIGMISSVQSLITRWDTFSRKEFSPAHAAFCFPTLAHANAIQSYRGAIDAFSDILPQSKMKILLDIYWFTFLVVGSLVTVIINVKYCYNLPKWTRVDVADEIEPPAPNETLMSEVILSGERLRQNFVSPAVLQANEAGALVRLPGRNIDGRGRYVRTRRITALGFEPVMNMIELHEERDALLEYVAKNPPRRRKRTVSVPGITFNLGEFGTDNTGVYSVPQEVRYGRRTRAQTSDLSFRGGSI